MKFSIAEFQARKGHFSNHPKHKQAHGICFHRCGNYSHLKEQFTTSLLAPGEQKVAQVGTSRKTLLSVAVIYRKRSSRCMLLQTSEQLVFAVIDLYGTDYINSCFLLVSTPPASPMIKMHLSIQQLLSNRTVSSCKVFNWEL